MLNIKNHHKGALYVLIALGISRALNIVSLPYLSKKLTASSFADYALFVTAISLLTALLSIGIDSSLVRLLSVKNDESDETSKKMFYLNALIAFVSSGVAFFILLLIGKSSNSFQYSLIFALTLLMSIVFPLAQACLRVTNNYKRLFYSLLIGGLATPTISVSLAYIGYVDNCLLYGFLFGVLISVGIATKFDNYKFYSFSDLKDLKLTNSLKIGLPVMATGPLFWVITSFDKWVANAYAGKSEMGIYALAATLTAPYVMIVGSLISAIQPHALSLLNSGDSKRFNEVDYEFKFLLFIMFLAWIVFVLAVALFVIFFMPFAYLKIIYITPILSVAFLFNGLFLIENTKFMHGNKTHNSIYAMACAAVISAIALFILIPRVGIIGAAISQVIGFIVLFAVAKKLSDKAHAGIHFNSSLFEIYISVVIFLIGYFNAIDSLNFLFKCLWIVFAILPALYICIKTFNDIRYRKITINTSLNKQA